LDFTSSFTVFIDPMHMMDTDGGSEKLSDSMDKTRKQAAVRVASQWALWIFMRH
jgi:hypothetical protein